MATIIVLLAVAAILLAVGFVAQLLHPATKLAPKRANQFTNWRGMRK